MKSNTDAKVEEISHERDSCLGNYKDCPPVVY